VPPEVKEASLLPFFFRQALSKFSVWHGASLGTVSGKPDMEGEVHQRENAEEGLQRVQIEGEDAAVDEGSAFGVEAFNEVEGGFDSGLAGEGGFHLGGGAEDVS
jgi:hypothetical protein